MTRTTTWVAALAALACVAAARAHHSISMFDIGAPIWVTGTVVRYDQVNPHAMITLEQTAEDGQARTLIVEGPGVHRVTALALGGDFVKPGDVIEVCGFAFKQEVLARNRELAARNTPDRFIHGHVVVLPEGRMRLFGGYGKLVNCIRPADEIPSWLEFLNLDQRARDAWCNGVVLGSVPSLAPKAFVDEVNRRMASPCPP